MIYELFESLPMAWVFVAIALVIALFGEIGYLLGKKVRKRWEKEKPTSLGLIVGGLLSMLAFVLAFSFSMAASQHFLRKLNVLNEANIISTAYLRSDLLEIQYATEVKSLLREYVDVRLQAVSVVDLDAVLARSVEIHKLLWAQVSAAAVKNPSIYNSLMILSINNLIDIHQTRVASSLRNRLPFGIWIALLAISALTMITMGTQLALSSRKRIFVAVIPLILAYAVLATVVVDLDDPTKGLITVGHEAMVDLQNSIGIETKYFQK